MHLRDDQSKHPTLRRLPGEEAGHAQEQPASTHLKKRIWPVLSRRGGRREDKSCMKGDNHVEPIAIPVFSGFCTYQGGQTDLAFAWLSSTRATGQAMGLAREHRVQERATGTSGGGSSCIAEERCRLARQHEPASASPFPCSSACRVCPTTKLQSG